MHDLFTDCNASSKVWLIDLEVLNYRKDYGNMSRGFKAPRKLWLMFLENKQHRQRNNRQFYRLQNTKEDRVDVLSRCIKSR